MAINHGNHTELGEALLADASWARMFVDAAVDGIIAIDEKGIIQFCNPATLNLLGYEEDELLGRNVSMLMPEPYRSEHDTYLDRYVAEGDPHIIGTGREVYAQHKEGYLISIHLSLCESFVNGRRVFVGNIHDLTPYRNTQRERDRLVDELRRRNVQTTALYRIGELVLTADVPAEVYDDVSRITCHSLSNPAGAEVSVVLDGDEHPCDTHRGGAPDVLIPVYAGDRRRGWIAVAYLRDSADTAAASDFGEDKEFLNAIANLLGESIERREAQAQVIQSSKLASIGELAAGVGHEINNPINGIINCADILIDALQESPDNQEFAQLIRAEADRIAQITKNLLTFARQDRPGLEETDLREVIALVLSLAGNRIQKQGVTVNVEVDEDVPLVRCQKLGMQQVFMNIVINALHALETRYPGKDKSNRIDITTARVEIGGRPGVRVSISDYGCGIPGGVLDRIFDPFFTTKGRDAGTGLGLSISDSIVRAHGGLIRVESGENEGATFHLDLPIDPDTLPAAEDG